MSGRSDIPLSAVVIDDEPLAAEGLRRLCERSGRVAVVGEARDGPDGLALIAEHRPQLVFLDIAMPGMSGLDVAGRLGEMTRPPSVVLVTAHDHYATEAFDLAVTDYLLKPVVAERLERAIDRALAVTGSAGAAEAVRELWVPHRGGVTRLSMRDVRRIDAERDYVRLHDADRSYLLRATITDLVTRLDPARFIRVHRSSVVALDQITGLRHLGAGAWAAVDAHGDEIRIGRSYLATVREQVGISEGM